MNRSPVPLFNQLEKIGGHKKEIEEKLLTVREVNLDQRLVPLETFSVFAEMVKKTLSENPDMNVRKIILQKFVKRIEVGVDRVRIFWNLDREHYNREILFSSDIGSAPALAGVVPSISNDLEGKIKKPSAQDDGFKKTFTFSSNSGSQSLTNGAPFRRQTAIQGSVAHRQWPGICREGDSILRQVTRPRDLYYGALQPRE